VKKGKKQLVEAAGTKKTLAHPKSVKKWGRRGESYLQLGKFPRPYLGKDRGRYRGHQRPASTAFGIREG